MMTAARRLSIFFFVVLIGALLSVGCDNSQNAAKEITAFSFDTAANPALKSAVTAKISGTFISATVPYGTNVTAMAATFTTTGTTVSVGGTMQVSGVTPNDFSQPVTYTVTGADNSTRDYTVKVDVASSSDKDISSFAFLATDNPGLSSDVTGSIQGTNIALTVPFGTDVSKLVATYQTTGTAVMVDNIQQVTGTTPNDFTTPVTYLVVAGDGSFKSYLVTVTIAASTAKDITAFSFLSAKNAGLTADVTGTISGTNIGVTVPYGTDVTALVATFSTTGTGVKVGTTAQVSGVTANNFTSPVVYTVTAADSSTQSYTVTVTVAANTAKDITAFSFTSAANSQLATDVTGTISGTNIAVSVPYGTTVTALIATFSTTGASVKVGSTAQVSGTTPNDFSSPVTYTVTAADSSTKAYTVTVTVGANPAKEITAFSFLASDNSGLHADAVGVVNGTNIAVSVPYGTDVTNLIATFTTTGASVAVGATAQTSGTTPNDFSNPVVYTVKAADNTTKDFTVIVTIAQNSTDMWSFGFLKADNAAANLSTDVTGTIAGQAIAVTVPYGTDPTKLVASFVSDGVAVKVGATAQVSGTTPNDFTSPVVYTVVAADTTTLDYTVTVTVAANPAKDITGFEFTAATNSGLHADAVGTIGANTIDVTVPYLTDVTALVATFTTTGQSVAVGATTQVSATTPNDFTNPVTYTVTAADNTTKTYTVTVTVSQSSTDMWSFSFLKANNSGLTADAVGTINGTNIAVTLPLGTDVTALVATFTDDGASVSVGANAQVSGTTPNDFSSPVTYTVTAADNTTTNYTVTVTLQ